MHNDHLGWILTCPSNLGTGLRAGAMVKVPLFSAREDFKAVCKKMGLQVRKFSNSILYQKFCLILKIGPRNSWSRLGLNRRNLGYFKCWSIRKIWNSTCQYIYRGSLTGLVENKNLFFFENYMLEMYVIIANQSRSSNGSKHSKMVKTSKKPWQTHHYQKNIRFYK